MEGDAVANEWVPSRRRRATATARCRVRVPRARAQRTRAAADRHESATPLLKEKTWAAVVVDPSHSVGKAAYVPAASSIKGMQDDRDCNGILMTSAARGGDVQDRLRALESGLNVDGVLSDANIYRTLAAAAISSVHRGGIWRFLAAP